MGNNISLDISEQNQVTNALTTSVSQQCITNCSSTVSNNNVILDNVKLDGPITFTAACNVGAQCFMTGTIATMTQNVLEALAKQESKISALPFQVDVQNINDKETLQNVIYNQIQNYVSATCNQDNVSIVTGNAVVVTNSSIDGGIIFDATANAKSNCTLNNSSTMQAFNQEKAEADQSASIEVSLFGSLFVGIILLFLGLYIMRKSSSQRPTAATATPVASKINIAPATRAVPATSTANKAVATSITK